MSKLTIKPITKQEKSVARIPNRATKDSIKQLEKGGGYEAKTCEEFYKKLGI